MYVWGIRPCCLISCFVMIVLIRPHIIKGISVAQSSAGDFSLKLSNSLVTAQPQIGILFQHIIFKSITRSKEKLTMISNFNHLFAALIINSRAKENVYCNSLGPEKYPFSHYQKSIRDSIVRHYLGADFTAVVLFFNLLGSYALLK